MKRSYQRIRLMAQLGIAGLLCVAGMASAAQRATGGAAEAQYRRDRQACMSGQSHQDRATCLQEAAAALSESRRNRLGDGGGDADYRRNALARCDVQPESERQDCRALARGEGVTRGSVEEGGVIRERTIRVPAASAPR